MRDPRPKLLANVLSELFARRGYARVQTATDWESAWKEAVGERFAAQTRAGQVRRGVLQVLVENSALLQELTYEKRQILKRLQELLPDEKLTDLRCRVGPLE